MVEYKGEIITDFFKKYATSSLKRTSSPPNPAEEPPATRLQSSSLSPLPSQVSSDLPNNRLAETVALSQNDRRQLSAEIFPLPAPKKHHPPLVTASFGSVLTQTSTIPSSQRIVRNGEIHICNSDDESDDSLEDLEDILNREKTPSPSPESQLPFLPTNALPAKVNKNGRSKLKDAGVSEPRKMPAKFSMQALLKQKEQYDISKRDVTKLRDLLGAQERKENSKTTIDADVLDDFMGSDRNEDDLSRLKLAIRRTEALRHDPAWSFFDDNSQASAALDFNVAGVYGLGPFLSDLLSRQQTFLSGFVEDYSLKNSLPNELLQWILDAACCEPRDDLRQAYTNVLRQASHQMKDILDIDRLNQLFQRMGACDDALHINTPVKHRVISSEDPQSNRQIHLSTLLDIIHGLAAGLDIEVQVQAISLLCRLTLDKSVTSNSRLHYNIETTLTTVLHHINTASPNPTFDKSYPITTILNNLYASTTVPTLRVQLLRSLSLLSPQWLHLRRQLALAYFFSSPLHLTYPFAIPFSLAAVQAHLYTPTFILNNSTDYTLLTSSIEILDVALDNADRPLHSSLEERAFNEAIDALAKKIKGMFMQIIDSGASNMRRTEAKEMLEGVHARLLYSVRTRPPRKKTLFGGEGEEYEVEKMGMKEFVKKIKKASERGRDGEQTEGGGVVNGGRAVMNGLVS